MHMFIKRLAIACFTLLSLGARGKIQQQAVSRTGRLSIFCRRVALPLSQSALAWAVTCRMS